MSGGPAHTFTFDLKGGERGWRPIGLVDGDANPLDELFG
jgi:hypothetical protein